MLVDRTVVDMFGIEAYASKAGALATAAPLEKIVLRVNSPLA